MSMPLVPTYDTKRCYATWVKQGGTEMRPATYEVYVPVRVTNATDNVIIPLGVFDSGSLNVTPGLPSLDIQVPCTDDPQNLPAGGWQVKVTVTFNDAPPEVYYLDVPVAGGDINLRTVVLPASMPAPQPLLITNVPGGLATLDVDGDVVDSTGAKVGGASTVDELTDATAIGKTVVKAADAAAVRTAIGAGTSSLALGTTSGTAKAGDYQPTAANISDATTVGRSVLTAADAAAVRTAIGAGTSSLALGTTAGTAAEASVVTANLATKATYVVVGTTGSGRFIVATTSTPAGMQAGDLIFVVPVV